MPLGRCGLNVLLIAALIGGGGCGSKPRPAEPKPASPKPAVRRRAPPPPRFSPAYARALDNVLSLEPGDRADLERTLRANPGDYTARLKLMAYHMRADRSGKPESREARAALVLWLIEHQPDSEILASPYAVFAPGQLTSSEYRRASEMWTQAAGARPTDARVAANAAQFYAGFDARRSLEYLESSHTLDPRNEYLAVDLGLRYASAVLSGEPRPAERARKLLETSNSPALLGAATRLFQSEYNSSLMRGAPAPAIGKLAERYFRRAQSLDPNLDETWIYPRLDPKMVGMLAPGAQPPPSAPPPLQLRKLSPSAFPHLPGPLAGILRERGCMVPQPEYAKAPVNVIRGQFFTAGTSGWAVLCSVADTSAILVFRDDADTRPQELARAADDVYFQGDGAGRMYYSRQIAPVDRRYIVEHYRAYGGPEPPPIDHSGIDDAFLEKASVVHYHYGGKWLQLTGAD